MLFYHHNLHRFVATYLNMQMVTSHEGAEELALQFERFMRSLDPADAPALFDASDEAHFDIQLGPTLRFARGYNVIIARETRNLQLTGDNGKWALDLTISAVTDHLRNWAKGIFCSKSCATIPTLCAPSPASSTSWSTDPTRSTYGGIRQAGTSYVEYGKADFIRLLG